MCSFVKQSNTQIPRKILSYYWSDNERQHIWLSYLQTALLFVPLMSWERWSKKTASTLKKQGDWGSISNRLDTSCFPNPKRRKCLQGFFMWNINSNLLYQSRTDWISSSSWLIRRRKSPWRIWTTEDLFQHCTMCILSSTMALWSKAEIQKYTFWWEKYIFEAIFPMLF